MARLFTSEDAAYAAGLVDGEGTFLFNKHRLRTASGEYLTITAHIDVAMTTEPVLRWLCATWGGYVIAEKRRKRRPNHSDVWRWSLAKNEDLITFLEAILPHMKVRRDAAMRLLDYARSRRGVRSRPKATQGYTPRERELAGVVNG